MTDPEVGEDNHECEEELQPEHGLAQAQVPRVVPAQQAEHHRGPGYRAPALSQDVT